MSLYSLHFFVKLISFWRTSRIPRPMTKANFEVCLRAKDWTNFETLVENTKLEGEEGGKIRELSGSEIGIED